MDALIGTYEDEWKRAVQDPDLRRQFKQFVNSVRPVSWKIRRHETDPKDERRPAIEEIVERGQTRAADWPKSFPGEKFTVDMIPTPEEQWKWVALATVDDLQPNDQNTTYVMCYATPHCSLTLKERGGDLRYGLATCAVPRARKGVPRNPTDVPSQTGLCVGPWHYR